MTTPKQRSRSIEAHLSRVIEVADDEVSAFLLNMVGSHPSDLVKVAAETFKLSRQAIQSRLRKLTAQGRIHSKGTTRSRVYTLGKFGTHAVKLPVDDSLEEDLVWKEFAAPRLEGLKYNLMHIMGYAFTEMLNNVRDHSGTDEVWIFVDHNATKVELLIVDNGVGIFKKIRSAWNLQTDNQAIIELRKGKLTTDPKRHSGEGIYFTSRMFDSFWIFSGKVAWVTGAKEEDWVIETQKERKGTAVTMTIDPTSWRTTNDVFKKYADPNSDIGISKTHVTLRLLDPEGPGLISRSQARRVIARLDQFEEVILDFQGIEVAAPAFLDEIFRVFAREHPDVKLVTKNVDHRIEDLLDRAIRMGRHEAKT